MSEESLFKSDIAVSKEQIRVNQTKTQTLLLAAFIHGEHDAFKEHLNKNPVHQNFDRSLADGLELVINGTRTLSDVAPTLIILLQKGAKLAHDDLIIPCTMTLYHVICSDTGDHQELLELMIKELGRSLLNATDDIGCTALMYAVWNANIKCVESLIANGADVYPIQDKPNVEDMITGMKGPLLLSIKLLNPTSPHPYNTMMGIFDILLDSGVDVNTPCFYRHCTPIRYAAREGNAICFKKLIQKGAKVNFTDRSSKPLWTKVARAGNVEILKCLLEDHGIEKDSTDKNGFSVLFWAINGGNIEAVRYLLKQGVTITSFAPQECMEACKTCGTNLPCYYVDVGKLYTDPFIYAVTHNKADIVRLMDEYGCEMSKSPDILSHAIRNKSVDVIDYLLRNYKYQLNCGYSDMYNDYRFNSGHQSFLFKAFETQSVAVIKLLLKHGADPNIKYCAETCPSAINVAIFERHVEITACLIRGGVSVNSRSSCPDIGVVLPFEVAVYQNHIYAAEMLLVFGCSSGIHSMDNNHTLKTNIGREMQELLKKWNVHKNNVLPLEQRCRMVILNHMCPQAEKKITELPLPAQIIKYLSIPEIDDIRKTFKCIPIGGCYIK